MWKANKGRPGVSLESGLGPPSRTQCLGPVGKQLPVGCSLRAGQAVGEGLQSGEEVMLHWKKAA